MTYNEWRDELKSNLLCVSEAERRRVLDYYAEAYADRREAGFSEREIIDDFGAPYDAAQRILYENTNGGFDDEEKPRRGNGSGERRRQGGNYPPPPPPPPQQQQQPQQPQNNPDYAGNPPAYAPPPAPAPSPAAARQDNTWVFVLLCVIFALPIFLVVMAMVFVTVGFCAAPVATIGSGAAMIINAFTIMAGGGVAYGLLSIGIGIIVIGVGVILFPLFIKLVQLMWKLFKKFFSWLKSLFSGKERA